MTRTHGRRAYWLAAAAATTVAFAIGTAASAQEAPVQTAPASLTAPGAPADARDPREARIETLEAELRALEAQVADLKASQSAGLAAVRADAAAQPTVSLAGGRPTFSTADGKFKVALRSITQFDVIDYNVSRLRPDNDLESGTSFRRARLGVDVTAFKDWNVSIWGDFGGSGGEAAILNQAYIEYAGLHPFGTDLRFRVGAWATPSGLEDATPTADLLFVERPAIAELVRGLDAGDGRAGGGAFLNGQHWYASGVFTGKTVGVPTAAEYGQQQGFVTRLAINPLHSAAYDVHLGGAVQGVIRPIDTAAGAATNEVLRLRQQPELRADTNSIRLVDTGNITASGLTSYSAEAGASFKNLYAAGEWYKIDVDRTAAGAGASPFDPSFAGWYVQGAWTLTGEHREWTSASGGFRGVRPAKAFNPADGSFGAWELAARYSVLDLNDHAGVGGKAAPIGGVRGGEQRITSVGLNWYPNSLVRFLLDYEWAQVDRLNTAGQSLGEHVDSVAFRSQFAF